MTARKVHIMIEGDVTEGQDQPTGVTVLLSFSKWNNGRPLDDAVPLLSVIKYSGSEQYETGIVMQTAEEYEQLGMILHDYERGWDIASAKVNQRGGGSSVKQPRKRAATGDEGAAKKKTVRVTKTQ